MAKKFQLSLMKLDTLPLKVQVGSVEKKQTTMARSLSDENNVILVNIEAVRLCPKGGDLFIAASHKVLPRPANQKRVSLLPIPLP